MPISAQLALAPPTSEKFTVRRKPNAEYRSREHLTETEVERLMDALKDNRYGHRDSTMVLLAWPLPWRSAYQSLRTTPSITLRRTSDSM
jgi:hypothetical protein